MRRSAAFLFAGLLASGAAIPAFAAWDPVGTVDFSVRDTHDAKLGNFKGYAVGLTARNSDVMCERVTATFGNGRRSEIFHGQLPRGETVTIDLPGYQQSVDRVDFDCRPTEGWRARVDIAADIGRLRNERPSYPDYSYDRPQYPDSYDRSRDPDYRGRPYWDRN